MNRKTAKKQKRVLKYLTQIIDNLQATAKAVFQKQRDMQENIITDIIHVLKKDQPLIFQKKQEQPEKKVKVRNVKGRNKNRAYYVNQSTYEQDAQNKYELADKSANFHANSEKKVSKKQDKIAEDKSTSKKSKVKGKKENLKPQKDVKEQIQSVLQLGNDYHDSGTLKGYDKKRWSTFEKNMAILIDESATYEQQQKALKILIKNQFIQTNAYASKKRKIYLNNNIFGMFPSSDEKVSKTLGARSHKSLMTGSQQQGGEHIQKILKMAEESNIMIPVRPNRTSQAQGSCNQKGMVALLHPTDQNKKIYAEEKASFQSVGGDVGKIHAMNQIMAKNVSQMCQREGLTIIDAKDIGGVGKKVLKDKYGIDNRKDPTDILLKVQKKNGKVGWIKISAKLYTDTNSILMKNNGLFSVGEIYFGDSGKQLDSYAKKLKNKPDYNFAENGISDAQRKERRHKYRTAYVKKLYEALKKQQAKGEEGQKTLLRMWNIIHGCGENVYTCIGDTSTMKSDMHDPDYFCHPQLPMHVQMDGNKLVTTFGTVKRVVQMSIAFTPQSALLRSKSVTKKG